MSSVGSLLVWCRRVCAGYPDVVITDMSSSFSDGLALCAIIHKHRPDLIDFDALNKLNVCENIRLAFEVAERELGVPALLDPQELACVDKPDLLSVVTYVSRLFSAFSSHGTDSSSSQKIPVRPEHHRTKTHDNHRTQTHTPSSCVSVFTPADVSVCAACNTHVHLIQRVLVKGKLYHRSCFRCSRCGCSLMSGSHTEDSHTGSLLCSHSCLLTQNQPAGPADKHSSRETESETGEREEDRGRDTSSATNRPEPPKPASRRRAEPLTPPQPAPRLKDQPPDKASAQSSVRKEHPWMKLVYPGPWYNLPPAPPPTAPPHTDSTPSVSQACDRRSPTSYNPFLEEEESSEDDGTLRAGQTQSGVLKTAERISKSCDPAGGPEVHAEEKIREEQEQLQDRLRSLEMKGVQLERDLRSNSDGVEEEKRLVDWFSLVHEKHMLVRRDAELVYMVKQQRLEDQQADVDRELRCLLNRPEQEWSSDDRLQEQQLMKRLLSIIHQRNDIINSLELDRRREMEEDTILAAVIQMRDVYTQSENKQEESGRKTKPLRVFKSLSRKTKAEKKSSEQNS